jgi:hypothetical protein
MQVNPDPVAWANPQLDQSIAESIGEEVKVVIGDYILTRLLNGDPVRIISRGEDEQLV